MLGHFRRLNPFLDIVVAISRVETQADQFFRHPPYYRAYFDARAGWQSESHQHRLCQRKLACVLQGHTIGSQVHTARGEGEVVSLDPDIGDEMYPWVLTGRGKESIAGSLRPAQGRQLSQESFHGHLG